ncbi:MAG TPA: energy transducer TonB [Terriglobales bacterium]|nr:energy transducer TonB [Terriglobales bacterium]
MILLLALEALTVAFQGLCVFSPPSGYRLTYDLGRGSRTNNNNRMLTLALLLFCLAPGSFPPAQAQSQESSGRKVIQTQQPDYPLVLKSKGIGGKVRLRARVLANGSVANVDIMGGNPVLAECAAKAVMMWRYALSTSSSNEIVTFTFNPH